MEVRGHQQAVASYGQDGAHRLVEQCLAAGQGQEQVAVEHEHPLALHSHEEYAVGCRRTVHLVVECVPPHAPVPVAQYLPAALEQHRVVHQANVPYLVEVRLQSAQQPGERGIAQDAPFVVGVVAQLVECSGVDAVGARVVAHRTHVGVVADGVQLPPRAVIFQQAVVVGKIHPVVVALRDVPHLVAGIELFLGEVVHPGVDGACGQGGEQRAR